MLALYFSRYRFCQLRSVLCCSGVSFAAAPGWKAAGVMFIVESATVASFPASTASKERTEAPDSKQRKRTACQNTCRKTMKPSAVFTTN
jgi:hypothetical protein